MRVLLMLILLFFATCVIIDYRDNKDTENQQIFVPHPTDWSYAKPIKVIILDKNYDTLCKRKLMPIADTVDETFIVIIDSTERKSYKSN